VLEQFLVVQFLVVQFLVAIVLTSMRAMADGVDELAVVRLCLAFDVDHLTCDSAIVSFL